MKLHRRDLVKAGTSLSLFGFIHGKAEAARLPTGTSRIAAARAASARTPPQSEAFGDHTVTQYARALAHHAYVPPTQKLPSLLSNLSFDQFSSITYNPEKALWAGDKLAFDVTFFPRGYLYKQHVEIFEVVDGQAAPVAYSPDLFTYGDPLLKAKEDTGFSGLRVRYALNTPGVMEECAVFLGASYFRAVAKGQTYGLSARGFAKDTGLATGEEFPVFRSFWLEKPQPGVDALVLHALMDSPSLTGAFRFTIRPGDMTLFDVQSTLFPRRDIDSGGVAPLTGMYYFDANDRQHIDDWRPAAHDSEALQIWTGASQQLYRPLTNPTDLQLSAFADTGPYGYGLMQRKRAFHDYEDLALHYEKRPSLWVEPIGNWGQGAVTLVEIPTPSEVNDNIVAFWRPKESLRAGQSYNFVYRMYWGWDTPWPTRLARVSATRVGAVVDHPDMRLFVLDFAGIVFDTMPKETLYHLIAQSSPGKISDIVLEHNIITNGIRALFNLAPGDAKLCEMSVQLATDQGPVSEKWMYRWTP